MRGIECTTPIIMITIGGTAASECTTCDGKTRRTGTIGIFATATGMSKRSIGSGVTGTTETVIGTIIGIGSSCAAQLD